MATKGDVTSKFDLVKWFAVLALIVAGVAANYYYNQQALAIRLIGWIILAGVVAFIAAQTAKGRMALGFAKEARTELRKVVWPNRQETIQTTAIVIVMVIIVALFLWGVDSILLWAVSWLTGQRG